MIAHARVVVYHENDIFAHKTHTYYKNALRTLKSEPPPPAMQPTTPLAITQIHINITNTNTNNRKPPWEDLCTNNRRRRRRRFSYHPT